MTATSNDAGAKVRVNGTLVASGSASGAIALAEGASTSITVVVTAEDATSTATYTVAVTRAASADATLAGLSLSAGLLTPGFVAATTSYTAEVGNAQGEVTVTATAHHPHATVTVDGTAVASGSASGAIALAEGASTSITVVVTAEDATSTTTYTVAVTRARADASSDATLAGLSLSAGLLTPGFAAATTSYTAEVGNAQGEVTVTATAHHPHATVTVDGTAVASGSASGAIALAEGASRSITVVVTAEDATSTATYTIDVRRAANAAPTAVDDIASTNEDTAVDIDVINNDTDTEGDTLSVTAVGTPSNGTAAIKSGSSTEITYTPNENFHGSDIFTYTVSDGNGATDTGTVTVTVTAVIDALMLSVDPTSVAEAGGEQRVTVTATLGQGTSFGETKVMARVAGDTASVDDFAAVEDFPVTIAAGDSSGTATFTLTPISDVLLEGDETVTVSGTAEGFTVTGTEVTIVDDVRVATQARTAVNRAILPQVTQAMTASTAAAVSDRIDAVTSGVGHVPSFNLTSQQTLEGVLQTVSDGLRDDTLTVDRLLGGSSFVLPLDATDDGQQTGLRSPVIWAKGDYRNLGGGEAIDWDGQIFTVHVGVDTRLSADLLVGLAGSWSKGSFDYAGMSGANPVGGSYESQMMSVHPYVNWSSPAGVDLWGSLGHGWGELAIAEQGARQTEVSDTTMQTATVGAKGRVLSVEGFLPTGTTVLRLKGEVLLTTIKVAGNGGAIEPLSMEARRYRLALEGLHEHQLASGGRLIPAVEIGVRYDGGDGLKGTGLELGAGLSYVDPTIGLTVDGRGRGLAAYGAQEYREWGASLLIQLDPGAAGQGLWFNVMPAYGQTASGVTRLWDQGLDGFGTSPSDASARLEAVVGYGLPALDGHGLVTPYSRVTLGSGGHRVRLGGRVAVGSSLNVSLEGTREMRREAPSSEATTVYAVLLQAYLRF